MAISSTVRKAGPFLGNGIAATFPFTFKVFAASDLIVVQTDVDGVATTLDLNTDYTVSLNADQDATPGGDVVLVAGALASDDTLVISSDIPATQGTSISNLGGFYPKVVEDAFDKLTILIQQMIVDLERSAQFPLSDGPMTTEFPPAAARAGQLLGFSDDGSFALLPISSFPGTYSYGEVPAGTMDGVNPTFTLANTPPSTILLFWNSAKLAKDVGFTLSGNIITMQAGYIPQSGDTLEAYYPLPSIPTISFGQVQEHRDIQHSGTETFSGDNVHTGQETFKSLNGVVNAALCTGLDFGAKLTAAIAALPSTGGVVDARELTGAQSLSANVTISKKHVRILFGNVTLAMGGFIFSIPAGTDGLALEGQPGYGGSDPVATAGGTYFVNTGNFSAIQVGTGATDTFGFMASDICVVTVTGGTTAQGFQLNRCINYRLKQCRVVMLATASTQYGIVLDGSGATYTSGVVYQPYISNGNKGIYFTGTAPNAANANQVIGGVVTGATAGSAIGIDIAQGDANCILGTDIEGYATGIRLAGSASNNFIIARLEANTTAVSCEASSSGNEIHISDPAAVVTDSGTNNYIYRGGAPYRNDFTKAPVGVPASAVAAGVAGTWSYDASYLYTCTATNTWKRVSIASW